MVLLLTYLKKKTAFFLKLKSSKRVKITILSKDSGSLPVVSQMDETLVFCNVFEARVSTKSDIDSSLCKPYFSRAKT